MSRINYSNHDPDSAVIDQMLAHGLPMPDRPLVLGKLTYYRVQGRKQDKAWYALHELRTLRGTTPVTLLTGAFGMWPGRDHPGTDERGVKVKLDFTGFDAQQAEQARQEAKRLQDEAAKKHEAQQARKLASAVQFTEVLMEYAKAPWEQNPPSYYLHRKGVAEVAYAADNIVPVRYTLEARCPPEWARGAELCVPMMREDKLVGAQLIWPDGAKRFVPGSQKRGSMALLGGTLLGEKLVLLAEGVATALTLREAVHGSLPVAVCWDCGNMPVVAEALRTQCPGAWLPAQSNFTMHLLSPCSKSWLWQKATKSV